MADIMPSTSPLLWTLRTLRRFWLPVVLFFGTQLQAAEQCTSEVKLLIEPHQLVTAAKAFSLGPATKRSIYFFDTPHLDLLSQGLIIRMRTGNRADLIVKRRLMEKETTLRDGSEKGACEFDVSGGIPFRSYSLQTKLKEGVPKTGTELFDLLSPAQKSFLQSIRIPVAWEQVFPIAEIQSTTWQVRGETGFPKLVLERWEWPTGSVLELSARVSSSHVDAYARLRELASQKRLQASKDQRPKTTLALESIDTSQAK